MMEKVYWRGQEDSKLRESLKAFAKEQAARLRIPLFEVNQNTPSARLESKGGRGPWEYVDSANGIHDRSVYTITNAQMIYDPTEVTPLSSR